MKENKILIHHIIYISQIWNANYSLLHGGCENKTFLKIKIYTHSFKNKLMMQFGFFFSM